MSERQVVPEEVRERLRSLQDAAGEAAMRGHAGRLAAMWNEMIERGVPYEVARDLISEHQFAVLEHVLGKGREA